SFSSGRFQPMVFEGGAPFERWEGDMPPFASPVPPHWSIQGPLRRVLLEPQQEYLTCAGQLLALIRDGQGESDEAMRIRGRMDAPWARMTAEQQTHVGFVLDEMARESDPRSRLRLSQ